MGEYNYVLDLDVLDLDVFLIRRFVYCLPPFFSTAFLPIFVVANAFKYADPPGSCSLSVLGGRKDNSRNVSIALFFKNLLITFDASFSVSSLFL